jgi:uncharacterized protein YprB with RNaseH-like and TPR domain
MSLLKERLSRLRSEIIRNEQGKDERKSNNEWLPLHAEPVQNEWGEFIRRRKAYGLEHVHGKYELGELLQRREAINALTSLTQYEPQQLLFFDSETTGLGIGTGNVPFMVGIAYFTRKELMIEQLLMRNPGEEMAMLHYLHERLQSSRVLVSYNGKSFDWPILKNRYILNRFNFDDQHLAHVDLLYPSRSLWKHSLPSCRLGVVEEKRIGFTRMDDIPGSLAPTYYFQFLSTGDPAILEGVFLHNEWDLLSLVSLTIHFSYLLTGEIGWGELDGEELVRLVTWLDKHQRWTVAKNALMETLSNPSALPVSSLNAFAALFKKKKEYKMAVHLWERSIQENEKQGTWNVDPFIELSKHYEHREREYGKALAYAEEALLRIWKRRTLRRDKKSEIQYMEVKHRITRLQRHLEKDPCLNQA